MCRSLHYLYRQNDKFECGKSRVIAGLRTCILNNVLRIDGLFFFFFTKAAIKKSKVDGYPEIRRVTKSDTPYSAARF